MANFNIPYEIEREGQMEFFDNYGVHYNDDDSMHDRLHSVLTKLYLCFRVCSELSNASMQKQVNFTNKEPSVESDGSFLFSVE